MSDSGGGFAEAYALARRTLIEAATALHIVSTSGFVLVGAHAVYLRAPDSLFGIPAFTFDGDLAVNPRSVVYSDLVRKTLEAAGFDLRGRLARLYVRRGIPEPESRAARVDVLVPARVAHNWSADRYDPLAALSQPGLEICLYDHSPMLVETHSDGVPPRSITLEVAGVVGLIVAKAWKLREREADGAEAFADVRKDVADVYRLLRVMEPEPAIATLRGVAHEPGVIECARGGMDALRHVLRSRGPGEAAMRALLPRGRAADIAARSLVILANEFADCIETALP